MSVPLQVSGKVNITFYYLGTNVKVKKPKEEWNVHEKILNGLYALDHTDGVVYNTDNEKPVYHFTMSVEYLEIFN